MLLAVVFDQPSARCPLQVSSARRAQAHPNAAVSPNMPKKKATAVADAEAEAAASAQAAAEQERLSRIEEAASAAHSRSQPVTSALRMSEAETSLAISGLGAPTNGCVGLDAVMGSLGALRVVPPDRSALIDAALTARGLPTGEAATVVLTVAEAAAVVSDVFASPKFSGEALRKAVGRGQLEKARHLLLCGCNPNQSDAAGKTAAHSAALLGQESALELLRECWGAEEFDFDVPDKSGWTPLTVACSGGFTGMVKLLLAWGADAAAATSTGRTPLHIAASCDQAAVIPLLAAAGAALDAVDAAGWTPMHVAAVHGAKQCVDALAAAGADASKQDFGGRPVEKLCHMEASLSLRKALRAHAEAYRPAAGSAGHA
jgi:hypothetical protein